MVQPISGGAGIVFPLRDSTFAELVLGVWQGLQRAPEFEPAEKK